MSYRPDCLKVVAVGDGGVGKTTMYLTLTTNEFPEVLVGALYGTYEYDMKLKEGDIPVHLYLCDTGGNDDWARLRPLSYPDTDVFILCFDVGGYKHTDSNGYMYTDSFGNITDLWYPELNHHCPKVPVILVATKIDLRDSEDLKTVTKEEGEAVAEEIKAAKYMEISSKRKEGLTELFDEVARIGYEYHSVILRKKNSRKCNVL